MKTARSKKLARSLGKKNSKDARLLGLIDAAALDQEQKKETEKKNRGRSSIYSCVETGEDVVFLQLLSKVEREEWPCTETKPTLHHRATARWHAMAPLFIAERMKVARWVRCHTV